MLSFLPRLTVNQIDNADGRLSDFAAGYVQDTALAQSQAVVARVDALLPEEDWRDQFEELATTAVTYSYAVALWAQPTVREALLAKGAAPPPESADDAPIEPPLADDRGLLRVPDPQT